MKRSPATLFWAVWHTRQNVQNLSRSLLTLPCLIEGGQLQFLRFFMTTGTYLKHPPVRNVWHFQNGQRKNTKNWPTVSWQFYDKLIHPQNRLYIENPSPNTCLYAAAALQKNRFCKTGWYYSYIDIKNANFKNRLRRALFLTFHIKPVQKSV